MQTIVYEGVETIKKRERLFIIFFLTGFLIIFWGVLLYTAREEQNILKAETLAYIRESEEYAETEITEMYIVNVGNKERKYSAVVHFEDEPDKAYFFTFEEDTD